MLYNIKNKVIERFKNHEKALLYAALYSGKRVMFTTNKRTAPDALISTDNYITIAINPKDISYFDYTLERPENILSKLDTDMIIQYLKKNGFEKSKKAYNQTFKFEYMQYDLIDVLTSLNIKVEV